MEDAALYRELTKIAFNDEQAHADAFKRICMKVNRQQL